MRLDLRRKQPRHEWHEWFAWRPVFVNDVLVWWERIERKVVGGYCGPSWEYRNIVATRRKA
jgi:hypothetical protein